jgi:hypothetical protein
MRAALLVATIALALAGAPGCKRNRASILGGDSALTGALDRGLGLPRVGSPASDLRLHVAIDALGPYLLETRRSVSQTLDGTSGAPFESRIDSAVALERLAEAQDGADELLVLTDPMVHVVPDLGTSTSRLAGLAKNTTIALTRGADGGLVAHMRDAPEAIAPLVETWGMSFVLTVPSFPQSLLASGDSWEDRLELPSANGSAKLTVTRRFTLAGTAPCRSTGSLCAVIVARMELAHDAELVEDEDTVTRLSGRGEGDLVLLWSIAGGVPDAAEVDYSLDSTIRRSTTESEDVTIRQARKSRILLAHLGGDR